MRRSLLLLSAVLMISLAGCGSKSNEGGKAGNAPEAQEQVDAAHIVTKPDAKYEPSSSFIVISKKDLTLTVYARSGKDTVALASYPVCMGKNKGNKEKSGDMRTPESPAGQPFTISKIQDASTWTHDFGDGRGKILAYGNWFLRLNTPGHSGIGIHGSTGNENTVPGRASEGCIRLLDKDIITLKEKYAHIDMPVIIKGEDEGLLPFETKCCE